MPSSAIMGALPVVVLAVAATFATSPPDAPAHSRQECRRRARNGGQAEEWAAPPR